MESDKEEGELSLLFLPLGGKYFWADRRLLNDIKTQHKLGGKTTIDQLCRGRFSRQFPLCCVGSQWITQDSGGILYSSTLEYTAL